ncbi:MAG: hypothetical protein ACRDGV_03405 [Candidatus Limnocylindria bacterium]
MDGYTVNEAASVLGVPTERIWELLARGVLSGTPEGTTGMRVFLQPRPGPTTPGTATGPGEPTRANGNGANDPPAEASPFRELLTEFRNLTERYGQALLALGEARGEASALRSRVEVLEARMDLRLPSASASPPPVSWTTTPMPVIDERLAASAVTADAHPEAGEPQARARRRRTRSGRLAPEEIAEALGRADDPSPSELPDGREAPDAEPLESRILASEATPRIPIVPIDADDALPRDAAPAEVVSLDEEPAAPGIVEMTTRAREAEAEPGLPPTAPTAPAPDSPYSTAIEDADWFSDAELTTDRSAQPFEEPWPATPQAEDEQADAENDFAAELEIATPGWRTADVTDAGELQAPGPGLSTEAEAGPEPWRAGEAWDVERDEWPEMPGTRGTSRSAIEAPEPVEADEPALEMPGSRELDEALAALDALSGPAAFEPSADEPPGASLEPPVETAPPESHPAPEQGEFEPPPGSSGSTSRAYGRLRRTFPG